MRDDFELPKAGEARLLAKLLVEFFKKEDILFAGGCKVFYSPEEWAEREEPYSNGAALVVVYDGGEHRSAMTIDEQRYDLNERMQEMLAAEGYFFEEGTCWHGGVYRTDPPKPLRSKLEETA